MEELTYQLEQIHFNGPLELLLHLIERNKINIYDIPIVRLTEQYMAYIRNMKEEDLDIVSDFLVIAATLLDIKAKMLLPKETDEDGEEIDPREELVERLLLYRRYQYMAEELETCEDKAAAYLYREGKLPQEVKAYVPPIDLDALLGNVSLEDMRRIFEEVLKRKEFKKDAVRAGFGVIRRERVSLGGRMTTLLAYARAHRHFSFRQMLVQAASRTEVVVTFLAVLELMKIGKISVSQEETCGEIEVNATESTDAQDTLDFSQLEDA